MEERPPLTTEQGWTYLVWASVATAIGLPFLLLDIVGVPAMNILSVPLVTLGAVLTALALKAELAGDPGPAPVPDVSRSGFREKIADGILYVLETVTATLTPAPAPAQEDPSQETELPRAA